ncbi:MAG: NAD-glutamate dehydrogenase, partial [Myxococcota bacterium]|nr:NAD-glutamate dehydrogenase [Myxococcota bacterium]
LYGRYADAFPEGYTEQTPERYAVTDVAHLEKVLENGRTRFEVFAHPSRDDQALIRFYSQEPMQLTSILPVVDNFGVIVVEQLAFQVTPTDSPALTVNTLRVLRGEQDLLAQSGALIDGLRAVFARRMRSDRLNRLLLHARITWQEIDLLRGYLGYARQIGHQLGLELIQKVLGAHSQYVSGLARLFRVRFDASSALGVEDRHRQEAALVQDALTYLDGVQSFEEDRILRLFLNLIQATIRTSFYRTREDGEHFISMKIDCALVRDLPEPRPLYEIYVHHAHMEGVHLRGGRVARGGIRWSDRLDDYRSEVLGLMATQMLKNTVIVPVGAKGGFVLKDPIEDWAEARSRADTLYRIFIRGLLEVTDNLVDGQVIAPERVVRYDDDDPYLVVAADKGTAHLSDTANAVAAEFGFWLGDAFASGGSVGYDHKIKGITARGAWVCVRHHFRELGLDPEVDPISVVGLGDMSGDVFGNGMLLSKSMHVVAAFNHRHIFLDPTPEPLAAWEERRRLFELPRSHWTDYDDALISEGGGVFDRGAKAITLSNQVADLLDIEVQTVSGEELIQHILRADVDLLWNGGIGTYVKASSEQHHDVEDTANDRVRVDAEELRCRVIGEGGNLGITMRGRVEFASQGGRVNLDAIDNSGGVDLSDH